MTLADEDTNSIATYTTKRQSKAMRQWKWRNPVAKFATNASGEHMHLIPILKCDILVCDVPA